MSSAFVGGRFYYPLQLLNEAQIASFKEALTYTSPFPDEDGNEKVIELYSLDDKNIGLPIEWVKLNFPKLYEMADDARVAPGTLTYSKLPNSNHPSVRDPEAQAEFMEEMANAVRLHNNVLVYAPTGSGKTVVALKTVAELGYRTLVLVHSEDLRDQWIKEIEDKLGIPRERIGIIQQNKCEIEGKDIVIGLLQTQARRAYNDIGVYSAFGSIIVDECHRISTDFFADVLPRFSAKYRIGLSATPHRKDGADQVLFAHLGHVRVKAKTRVMPIKVYVRNYYSTRKLHGLDERQRISHLSKDKDRNNLIITMTKQLYDNNRNVVVVSNSVKHLEKLMQLAVEAGIPSYEIGLFSATRSTYDRNHEWKVTGVRKSTDEEKISAKNSKVIFAVDALIKESVDIPRLDAGIDAVPFWNATQRLGRIRRYAVGKLYPKWITIRDMKCTYSSNMYNARLKDYNECQAAIIQM